MSQLHSHFQDRLLQAAEALFQEKQYVCLIDVFLYIGWLDGSSFMDWRQGKLSHLTQRVSVNQQKIDNAILYLQDWVKKKQLNPMMVSYLIRTRSGQRLLRFTAHDDTVVKQTYETIYVSPLLSQKKQSSIVQKLSQLPEQTVYITTQSGQCSDCTKELSKNCWLTVMEGEAFCLSCAGLDDLEFLPSGDAKQTREAKKYSDQYAVVLKFSRARKRYERQGLLVQKAALS